jgi:DNA (cytosine-5)-methyltransferase 1
VPGIISSTHLPKFKQILREFNKSGYTISFKLLDARDYGVPQERKRVIIVGYRNDLRKQFEFPPPTHTEKPQVTLNGASKLLPWRTLKDAIGDLPEVQPAKEKNYANENLPFPNQECMHGSYSTIYMSRNRRKNWSESSFTIQAGGRHAPQHPSSSKMKKVGEDKWVFVEESPKTRRLSVRECARIQTFPDDFIFYYKRIDSGYKMIGNAVPVILAEAVARKIMSDLKP